MSPRFLFKRRTRGRIFSSWLGGGLPGGRRGCRAGFTPELAGAFEAALPLAAGRFHGAAPNGSARRQFPVVHPAGVCRQVVLFAAHGGPSLARRQRQRGQFPQQFGAAARPTAAAAPPVPWSASPSACRCWLAWSKSSTCSAPAQRFSTSFQIHGAPSLTQRTRAARPRPSAWASQCSRRPSSAGSPRRPTRRLPLRNPRPPAVCAACSSR